jgi:L-cysteine S-thiosulfotransferase
LRIANLSWFEQLTSALSLQNSGSHYRLLGFLKSLGARKVSENLEKKTTLGSLSTGGCALFTRGLTAIILATAVLTGTVVAMGLPDQTLTPLTAEPGDVTRGRDVMLKAEKGNCILCHAVPEPGVRFSGDLGPPLHGVGARLSAAQLRYRVIDASRLNPETVMPAYHRSENLKRVAPQFQGLPILNAQEIEDLVAYLSSLK